MSVSSDKAKELLKHYFGLAGVNVNGSSDHQLEIEDIVDCIIQAAVNTIAAEPNGGDK